MEMRMTYGRRFLYALAGIFLLNISVANAAAVIDFGTGLAGPGGTLSYDGVNTIGANVNIGALTAQGTPAGAGTYAITALLNFDTGANTISIVGDVPGLGIPAGTTLLTGSFSSFTYTAIPGPGGTTEIFSGQGPDVKNTALLSALGVPVTTPFDFFGFSIESVNGTVVSTDIVNTAVPVPAAVWLFGSGLLGLVGIARRKTA